MGQAMYKKFAILSLIFLFFLNAPVHAGSISEVLNLGATVDEGLTLILPTNFVEFNFTNPDVPGKSMEVLPSNPELANGFAIKLGAQVDMDKKVALYVKAESDNITTSDLCKVISISNLSISPHTISASDSNMRISKRTSVPGPSECNNFDGTPGGNNPLYGLRIYEQSGPGSSEPVYQLAMVNSWNYQPGDYTVELTFTLIVE